MVEKLTDEEVAAAVGQEIAYWRRRRGYTREFLGFLTAISENTVGRYERGETQPVFADAWRLATALNVPMSDFVKRIDASLNLEIKARARLERVSRFDLFDYRMESILGDPVVEARVAQKLKSTDDDRTPEQIAADLAEQKLADESADDADEGGTVSDAG